MKHKLRTLHFVGIGGAGMSGIAEVLLNLGYRVSGSDIAKSETTSRLQKLGAKIYIGHHEKNLKSADAVVVSSAVTVDNPEVRKAKQNNIPIVARAIMLSELMRMRQSIAVAGSHGKTTSTSLIAAILGFARLDPTYVIGGLLNAAGVNAKLGKGEYIVVEADESDRSFLNLYPMITMITNINKDHLENYSQDFVELKKAFIEFIAHLPFYGLAVLCADDQGINDILPFVTRPKITYGLSKSADYRAENIKANGRKMSFTVIRKNLPKLKIVLNHPGIHSVVNALGAIAVADEVGVSDNSIIKALAKFTGVGRRVEEIGEIYRDINIKTINKALVIEDYGHHPTEVLATVKAIAKAYPKQKITLVFQPHRYTRTRDCFYEFVQSFCEIAKKHKVVLTDIYAAGEKPILSATGANLSSAVLKASKNKNNIKFIENVESIPEKLQQEITVDEVFLIMGAGSIGKVFQTFIKNQKSSKSLVNKAKSIKD